MYFKSNLKLKKKKFSSSDWNRFEIDGVHLDDFIFCWSNQQSHIFKSEKICSSLKIFRFIDAKCKWPDCTHKCPPIKHPDNEKKEINPLEYFSYYGLLSFGELAKRLNIREFVLRNMRYENLFKLIE